MTLGFTLSRCPAERLSQGPIFARTPEELYPDRDDLQDMRESLPGDWPVATNRNNQRKKTIIQLATEVAGLEFGKDVIVQF